MVAQRMMELAGEHRVVATVEDNGRVGGVGAAVRESLHEQGIHLPTRVFGVAQRFLDHGKRATLLAESGLSARNISQILTRDLLALGSAPGHMPEDTPEDTPENRPENGVPEAAMATALGAQNS